MKAGICDCWEQQDKCLPSCSRDSSGEDPVRVPGVAKQHSLAFPLWLEAGQAVSASAQLCIPAGDVPAGGS